MRTAQIGGWYYRWHPSTTTLLASRNRHCFDSALEPSVRRYHVTRWSMAGGHSIPAQAFNGHTAREIREAFTYKEARCKA